MGRAILEEEKLIIYIMGGAWAGGWTWIMVLSLSLVCSVVANLVGKMVWLLNL